MHKSSLFLLLVSLSCFASDWTPVEAVMAKRQAQTAAKMKLTDEKADAMLQFLKATKEDEYKALQNLQKSLPKTSLELLFAIKDRGVSPIEAENMAVYLQTIPSVYHIKNIALFDENTSHIIGREWHEIDYSGEGMTWQKQKAKYAPYGITDFKSTTNLKKFFPIESRLPYFRKIYN